MFNLLESFPYSKFILIGDSGEQDLELYCQAAIERPDQVLAILVRDITSSRASHLRRRNLATAHSISALRESSESPAAISRQNSVESSIIAAAADEAEATTPTSTTSTQELQELTAAQQKILRLADHWDERVAWARKIIPEHVPLFLFRDPSEIRDEIVALVKSKSQCDS